MPEPWHGLTPETALQADALTAWKLGHPLIYMRPSGTSSACLSVEPTTDAIERAEAAGWVAPDPITFARRSSLWGRTTETGPMTESVSPEGGGS